MTNYIRTSWTYYPGSAAYETPEGESKTVPDMTLSLKELVNRYTRSGQIGEVAAFEPVYDGDIEVPHFERMTPQERLDFAKNLKASIAETRRKLSEQNKMATKVAKEAEKQLSTAEPATSGEGTSPTE